MVRARFLFFAAHPYMCYSCFRRIILSCLWLLTVEDYKFDYVMAYIRRPRCSYFTGLAIVSE